MEKRNKSIRMRLTGAAFSLVAAMMLCFSVAQPALGAESAGSAGETRSLTLGQVYTGTMTEEYDSDVYSFELSNTSTIEIELKTGQNRNACWVVSFDTKAGDWISYHIIPESDSGLYVANKIRVPAGEYEVSVAPYGGVEQITGIIYDRAEVVGRSYELTVSSAAPYQEMYRLYNQWSGEHFYTASEEERDSLKSIGWIDEGVGWLAPTLSWSKEDAGTIPSVYQREPTGGDPVYRLYNPYVSGGDHHYTMNEREYYQLGMLGWIKEGVGWYSAGDTPVYRQFNPYVTTGSHNYTTSKQENDQLVSLGWHGEGIGWYAIADKR